MPKRAKELTAKAVRELKHPGTSKFSIAYPVGGVSGLLLQVAPSGSKSWILRATIGKRRRDFGLGSYPDVTLAKARERAREARDTIWRGLDPIEEKRAAAAALAAAQARSMTFADAWERYAKQKVLEFSTDRYRVQWRRTVEKYALPAIGKMQVAEVEMRDVLRVLQPLWTERTETAVKLRERIEKALAWAIVQGYRPGPNPAAWKNNLEMVLPSPSRVAASEKFPALQIQDAQRWWAALRIREGVGAQALSFQAMTAARSGAVRFATWSEFDFENRVWTIQPGRQASKIPNNETAKRIPLTEPMVRLLKAMPRLRGSDALVFSAPRLGALSDATLAKQMRTIHEADLAAGGRGFVDAKTLRPAVPHGLRSCFRTWVAEKTTFDADMAEVALFHKVGTKVSQAYDRSDQLEKRRAMMTAWCDFLDSHGGDA